MDTISPKFSPEQYLGLSAERIQALGQEDWFSPEIPQPATYEVIREPWGIDRWDNGDGEECEETGGPLFRLTMPNGASIDVWPSSGGEEFFDEWLKTGADWEKWLEYVRMDPEFSETPEEFHYCFREFAIALAQVAVSDSDLWIEPSEGFPLHPYVGKHRINLSGLGFRDNMLDPFTLA